MVPKIDDILRVLPEMVWCGFGVLLMLVQPFIKSRQALTFIAMLGAAAGTLYGTDVYTLDSSLSAAVVHAGLAKAGQAVTVRVRIIASVPQFIVLLYSTNWQTKRSKRPSLL